MTALVASQRMGESPSPAWREEMRSRPFMGVQLENGEEGVPIGSVTDDGPAQKAAIQAGDRLISMELGSRG